MDTRKSAKINFHTTPELKANLEGVAHTLGKNLTTFLTEICNRTVEENKDLIIGRRILASKFKFPATTDNERKNDNGEN